MRFVELKDDRRYSLFLANEILYGKLVVEGWENLVYLTKDAMFPHDTEGTVDGTHPNDWGMMALAKTYGNAVKKALGLTKQAKLER